MVSVLLASGGEVVPTMNTDWKNATKEYMKFQKMNPIFGKPRRKLFDTAWNIILSMISTIS